MFRLWAKLVKDNRLLKDTVICNEDPELNRTRKIYKAIEESCGEFDLAQPVWLDSTIREFQQHDKCRFTKDNFMEEIAFDYLEIEMLEEDDWW